MRVNVLGLNAAKPTAKKFTLIDTLNPDTPINIVVRRLGIVMVGHAQDEALRWTAALQAGQTHLPPPPNYQSVTLSESAAIGCQLVAMAQVDTEEPYTREEVAHLMLMSDEYAEQVTEMVGWILADIGAKPGGDDSPLAS